MRWLAAGLAFVNASTVGALLLGILFRGLSKPIAVASVLAGAIVAALVWRHTAGVRPASEPVKADQEPKRGKGRRRPQTLLDAPRPYDYRKVWMWLLAACFALLAVRSFCWLLYIDGNELKVQSPNNLGDLALHITYIRTFANGVALWPDNPIYVFSKLRYPAGTDLFNGILTLLGLDLTRGLVWTGLVASIATFYAFYRWAGNFGVAAFLFNGGLAGFQFFASGKFLDYQGDKLIAWKSLALSMFVPQRGMLYALPVGLLLLCQWRGKYTGTRARGAEPPSALVPVWFEICLYATLPLFHAHTFLALSIVLAFFFLLGDAAVRRQTFTLAAISFVPATFCAWLITDHFHAGSVLEWKLGWVQRAGDFALPFFTFWLLNFGAWIPVVLATISASGYRAWKTRKEPHYVLPQEVVYLGAATALFLFAYFVKTAPWEWDNIKIIVWAYIIVLPFVWQEVVAVLPVAARVPLYLFLFGSGLISLFGGLAAGRNGFTIAQRGELDGAGSALRKLPIEARFATFPTYNHPVLLQGRKAVLGYPGHLWTQGFNYAAVQDKLKSVMLGKPGWKETAHELEARYLFWGREEIANYPLSTRPWEHESEVVASGPWGAIFDLEKVRSGPAFVPRQ
ncbi:MAG: hypothetical protein M3Z64_12105 [Verrucomicrobiota bacterium]|nr:hypothetical protein [Verrucomicrobiota bacterium]